MLAFAAISDESRAARRASLPDEDLLLRIAREDKDAFCTLYEQTSGAVYAYALSLLRHSQDAEDVMQETFLKIRGAAHLYTPQGKPMAWILTITRNLCMMRFRQQRRTAAVSVEAAAEDPGFDRITDLEDRIVLKAALESLTPEESRIIVLHAVSGLKHRQIGELLDLPLSTVLSKYSRGLKKLRKELEGKL